VLAFLGYARLYQLLSVPIVDRFCSGFYFQPVRSSTAYNLPTSGMELTERKLQWLAATYYINVKEWSRWRLPASWAFAGAVDAEHLQARSDFTRGAVAWLTDALITAANS
jgi:hypothetical protein